MEDLEGRRIWDKLGRRAARSRNLPLRVSLLWRSTALWVALRSAVFARLLGFRFICAEAAFAGWELARKWSGSGRPERDCMVGEMGVRGVAESSEEGELREDGAVVAGRDMAI
jgi:hypothetical protein